MKNRRLLTTALLALAMSLTFVLPAAASSAGFTVDCTGAFGFGDVPVHTTYTWFVRLFDPGKNSGTGFVTDQTWQGAIDGGDNGAAFNPQVLWPITPSQGTTADDSYYWVDIWNFGTGEHVFHAEGHFDCPPPPPPPPPPHEGGQGCTPGYWKQSQHFDSWVGYNAGQDYETVFGVDASFTTTLLGALGQGGGGEKALGRHATAALLNAANPDVSYLYSEAQVITMVQGAYASGDFEGVKNLLAEQNELGCPLD